MQFSVSLCKIFNLQKNGLAFSYTQHFGPNSFFMTIHKWNQNCLEFKFGYCRWRDFPAFINNETCIVAKDPRAPEQDISQVLALSSTVHVNLLIQTTLPLAPTHAYNTANSKNMHNNDWSWNLGQFYLILKSNQINTDLDSKTTAHHD